jgi:hypothetical protein
MAESLGGHRSCSLLVEGTRIRKSQYPARRSDPDADAISSASTLSFRSALREAASLRAERIPELQSRWREARVSPITAKLVHLHEGQRVTRSADWHLGLCLGALLFFTHNFKEGTLDERTAISVSLRPGMRASASNIKRTNRRWQKDARWHNLQLLQNRAASAAHPRSQALRILRQQTSGLYVFPAPPWLALRLYD